MTETKTEGKAPVFDPVKLQEVNAGKDYPMEPDEFEALFVHNCYCSMAHINKKGYPIVTPMFYIIKDGFLYMSSIKKFRHKVLDLEENPKISVSIANDGANARRQKAILLVGHAEVSYDPALLEEIHWKIIDKYWSDAKTPEIRQAAFNGVHTSLRAIIKVVPEKTMSWDFGKMVNAYEKGVWFNEAYEMSKPHDVK